jgi:glycosyltransferase involved in cell wall biosynthesis
LFVLSGIDYSGAEIVLERYLENNNVIDPYFAIIYNTKKNVVQKFVSKYGNEKVFTLEMNLNKNMLRYAPFIESIKIVGKLNKYIDIIKPNVIYANNTIETLLVGYKKEKYKIPIIGHIHDMKSSIKSPIRVYYTRKSIEKIHKVLTVSNACKNDWNENMEVIYNGLEESYFHYSKRSKIETISYIGSISSRKGSDIFLNAIENILLGNNSLKINIAYNNIESNDLKDILEKVKSKFSHRVKIFERLPFDEIIKLYNTSDLIIVPSRHDPLPTVIMEALGKGTLAIGANIDGIPELLNNEEKLLFAPNDVNSLVNKINEILTMNLESYNKLTKELYDYSKINFNSKLKENKLNTILLSLK